jgi:O-antigen/teichoic acid export membrane protein
VSRETGERPEADQRPAATIGGRGATRVALASVLAAAAGYVVLVLASRTLTTSQNADFLAFWSLMFGMFGVLAGVQTETTRGVRHAAQGGRQGVRALPYALAVGVGLAAVMAATSPLWATAVLGPSHAVDLTVVLVAVVLFAGHSSQAGALSGAGAWDRFADLVGLEALMRVAATALAAAAGAVVGGFEAAAAAGACAWLVLLVARPYRRALHARVDVDGRGLLRRLGHAMAAAAASAVMVVGFPVLLRVTSTPAEYAAAAPLILAVSLTRAPLLIPLSAFQGVVITHVIEHRDRGLRALRPVVVALAGAGVVGAVLAALVGPALMRLLFGPAYGVEGAVLAGLTVGAVGLALLTLTGAVTVALGSHRAFSAGWIAATLVTVVFLLLPWSITARTVTALLVGPLTGVVVHLAALRRARPGRR